MGNICFKHSSNKYEQNSNSDQVQGSDDFDTVPGRTIYTRGDQVQGSEDFDTVPGRTIYTRGDQVQGSEDFDTVPGRTIYTRGDQVQGSEDFDTVPGRTIYTRGPVQGRLPGQSGKNILIVAAIDFGTTFSGYGYSYVSDPDSILTNVWSSGKIKTPTVVLLNQNKQFHSFGEEARTKYMELIQDSTYEGWYFFENFKMKLYAKKTPLEIDVEIKDILGRPMKAFDIFTMSIKYIRKHLLEALHDSRRGYVDMNEDTDIRWVITVPAIWNDLSKLFMRKAALKAGISNDLLTLALEPEAASLFCKKTLRHDRMRRGCRYMVVDIGGGTTDITCHEIQGDDTLKEIHPPSGGDFGGTNVDNKFMDILTSFFGKDVMETFKRKHMSDYWEMMTEFQLKKCRFGGIGDVHMKFSFQLSSLFTKNVQMEVSEALSQWPRYPGISFRHDKIKIAENDMREIFDVAIDEIVQKVRELEKEIENIGLIILVGGFSESPYLKSVMERHFDNIYVLPKEPSAAVLKGAVTYGHEAKVISVRKSPYTFGIPRFERFNPDKHPESKMVKMDDFTYCDGVFNKHIEIGTEVRVDKTEVAEYHKYFPSTHNQNMAVLEVYKSKEKNPSYVDDDGCEPVGYIIVDGINPRNNRWCKLFVRLIFGGTELIVEVSDEDYKIIKKGSVSFLE